MDDARLWQQCLGGDSDAFGELFVRHADAVLRYCFRRTASRAAAEDLLSVVFLEAWRCRRQLTVEGETALPLLFGIAHRVTSKHERSLYRHQAALRRISETLIEPDHADAIAQRLDDEQRMLVVRQALASLPRHERDVLELHVLGELDQKATAEALGIRVGTVRSRLSRARGRLAHLTQSPPSLGLAALTDDGKPS